MKKHPKPAMGRAAIYAAAVLFVLPACRHAAESGKPDTGIVDGGPSAPVSPNTQGWWRHDVVYEIFVRSFQDSNGDGKGDLAGLTSRLDYLNDGDPNTSTDLGVDAVWLMPIYPSPSYHGYDVTNYRNVDSDYGSLDDFDAFVKAAHARGIKVILDITLNHTSSAHPWFVSAKRGPDAPYRDYYVWSQTEPEGWSRPWDGAPLWHQINGWWYYGLFWSGMPDLNWRNPAVESEMEDTMRFWLGRGVDGFRIDAARYLVESDDGKVADQPETHEVFKRIRKAIHQDYPDTLFVGEVWTDTDTVATYYGSGDELQLAFSFDLASAVKEVVNDGTKSTLNQIMYLESRAMPDRGYAAPFLSNHDMIRVMRDLKEDPKEARLAAALLMVMPGTPFIYYGEELGMVGGPATRDEDKRTPMHWTADTPHYGFTDGPNTWYGDGAPEAEGTSVSEEQADPGSLWHLYQRLIALRHGSPALSGGAVSRPRIDGGGRGAFAVLRTAATGERTMLVVNLYTEPTGPFTVAVDGTPTVLDAEGLGDAPVSLNGVLSFPGLDPQSFAFISLD